MRKSKTGNGIRTTLTFLGIRITSSGVVFILDVVYVQYYFFYFLCRYDSFICQHIELSTTISTVKISGPNSSYNVRTDV